MRAASMSASSTGGPKTGLLVGLLLQVALVSAATIPAAAKVKRESVTDFLTGIVSSFQSKIPTVSQNSTDMMNSLLGPLEDEPYVITQKSKYPIVRSADLGLVRGFFRYGDSLAGGPSYPTGTLGVAKNVKDINDIVADLAPEIVAALTDGTQAEADASKYNGLQTLEDYAQIYNGEWLNTMPNGPALGVKTNYTQDLYFSMQRLSTSPYQIRRLRASDALPFTLDDDTANEVAGMTLPQLFEEGRLFYADYRDQASLNSSGRFAATCDAYFYINATSGEFLPLAIRTNVGSNLVYTPADSPGDWLLAKMMYNVNDFWFAQWNHLAATHEVAQIVWMAAIRTLSHEHPIFGILNRLMFEVFSIQALAEDILFVDGGVVDSVFSFTGTSARDYTTAQYKDRGAGRFQANFFKKDLRSRGLIDYCHGPRLKHFPFYEDAGVIHDAIHTFITSFVKSYYSSDTDVYEDSEVQAWVAQANGPAQVMDFPAEIKTIDALVEVLTQLAHLVSSAHHTVNTNELLQVSSTLPFCPPALYASPPTEKSDNTNPVDFLPPLEKILQQLIVGALFARPQLVGTNRTIIHMFDDQTMLSLMNAETKDANAAFMSAMEDFSAQVSSRTFDADGLSQGMPFLWKALDPNVAPYAVTV